MSKQQVDCLHRNGRQHSEMEIPSLRQLTLICNFMIVERFFSKNCQSLSLYQWQIHATFAWKYHFEVFEEIYMENLTVL